MFTHVFRLDHAPDEVLAAHRDGLVGFGPSLPGVASVERLTTVASDRAVHLAHRWYGDPGCLPRLLRSVVPADRFVWHDRSTWTQDGGTWAITIDVLGPGPHLSGSHRFLPAADGGCEVVLEASVLGLALGGDILGVPLGRWGARVLERLVHDMLAGVAEASTTRIAEWMSGRRDRDLAA
ncbi:MAG: hypothetical protein KC656_02900 [Myxococcales bacterium]|nr:hypothetical protein [Myxococcales bacterium]